MAKFKIIRLLTVKKDSPFWPSIEKHGTATGLHCRLVFSFLTFRKVINRGAGLREISRETTLHPKTVKNALVSLKEIVEKRGKKWFAVEPPEGWFIIARKDNHWARRFAYMKLLIPMTSAKITVDGGKRRFGLNHAAVYSLLRSKADKGLVKFTSAEAISALLNGVHRKTISSVLADLETIGLISSECKVRRINVTLYEMTDDHRALFRHRDVEEADEPSVTSTPKKHGYEFSHDGFDDWRKLCESRMSQKYADEAIRVAKTMNWDRHFFEGELNTAVAKHNDNLKNGKCHKTNFGKFFCTRIEWSFQEYELARRDAEAQARFEAYAEQYQRQREQNERAIAADPTHRDHLITEKSVMDRVDLGGSLLKQYQEAARLLQKIEQCCRGHLLHQVAGHEFAEHTTQAVKIVVGNTLAALNSFYLQSEKASINKFEKAIDRVVQSRIADMKPIFSTTFEQRVDIGLVTMEVGECPNEIEVAL